MAAIHNIPELYTLSDELFRRKPHKRKAPAKSRKITVELAAEVREYASIHYNASQQDIGTRFGINAGRVSEILAGYRE